MKVLQLTVHFSPNIGGVETHLGDLVKGLAKRNYEVFVLTYRPLVAKTAWKMVEAGKNYQILRLPWIPGFFYQFVKHPIIEFLYLTPGLFFVLPIILLAKQPDVIHTHGIVAGFVGAFWGKLLRKRVVVSIHNIYHFPSSGLYRRFATWIFKNSDYILCLSKQSCNEVKKLDIKEEKIIQFTYWIDLQLFKRVSEAKKRLQWDNKFVVLFVGRLVPEKGVYELLEASKLLADNIVVAIAGVGPLASEVKKYGSKVLFLGKISNEALPLYYSGADVVIVPSVHEEGFGRVILESLACGTPLIAAKRGAIVEAMDETVGEFITITPQEIAQSITKFQKASEKRKHMSEKARKYAEARYSEENIAQIIKAY